MGDYLQCGLIAASHAIEEAEEKAHAAYYHGCVEWQDCDLDIEARIKEKDRGER